MARSNLVRLFSSISDISAPKLTESLIRYAPNNSAARLLSSVATNQPPAHHLKEQNESPKSNLQMGNQADKPEGEDEDDDDDGDVNKVTGEIGGPRGPEPTRYGDWERAGRCSDF